jgi:hypothetical protein
MVGLSDVNKAEAGSNIRNRTSRLNRSSEAMKSAKENGGYDSSGGGGPTNHIKRGTATVHELQDQHVVSMEESLLANNRCVEQLMLEDRSSSTQSNPVDPYEMMIQQQPPPHRTPRQHQTLHQKPPHHVVPITHTNRKLEESKETSSPKRWGKNIEESISGILKRLDQLAADHEQHGGKLFFFFHL